MTKDSSITCVAIPVYNRLNLIQNCLDKIEKQLKTNIFLLLVDDGSSPEVSSRIKNDPRLKNDKIFYVRHNKNMGISAARNTALKWCREYNIDIIIMVDSDCDVPPDFIQKHIDLHLKYPEVACFGGGINGVGSGYWATIDKIMSWAHAVPFGNVREFNKIYYPPTANISFKMNRLPVRDKVFDERLSTGEDVLLVRELRKNGEKIYFSPDPSVDHFDRNKMKDVIRHTFAWGEHMYFIQLGNDISERCFKKWYRFIFFFSFLPSILAFAGLGAFLVLKQWFKHKPSYIMHFPLIFMLWFFKGIAILKVAVNPLNYLLEEKE